MAEVRARIATARDRLLRAPLERSWLPALEAVAAASGARLGQLISQSEVDVQFNWMTGIEASDQAFAEKSGLVDLSSNPRLEAGRNGQMLQILADQNYVQSDARAKYPIYGELFDPLGFSFNCQAVVLRTSAALIRTSVSRSTRCGAFGDDELKVFAGLAKDIQTAVSLQLTIEHDHGALISGALDTASSAAIVIDNMARVIFATRSAEALMSRVGGLGIRNNRVTCARAADQGVLDACIARAISIHNGANLATNPTISLAGACKGGALLEMDVAPLPGRDFSLPFAPAVLICLRERRESCAWARRFGLTPAEARVAEALARGATPQKIAEDANRSLATVRTQIAAVYGKLGVRRQLELATTLLPLLRGE